MKSTEINKLVILIILILLILLGYCYNYNLIIEKIYSSNIQTIFFILAGFLFTFRATIITNLTSMLPENLKENTINLNNYMNKFIYSSFVFGALSCILYPIAIVNQVNITLTLIANLSILIIICLLLYSFYNLLKTCNYANDLITRCIIETFADKSKQKITNVTIVDKK